MFPDAPTIKTESVSCGLCHGQRHRPYARSYDYEYQSCRNEWTFVECEDCGNVYLNPRPARSELATIYPSKYYSYDYEQSVNSVALRVKEWLDERRFTAIRGELGTELRAYLDIGCGSGRYLRAVARAGVSRNEIYGVELDAKLAERLRGEGFQVEGCPFEEAKRLPQNHFTLITLFSVLEHVPSPKDALERAYDLLHPGGMLVFEAPNIASTNARLFRRRFWGGYHTPRHWNLFSLSTLLRVARPMGYQLKKVEKTTGHAFWMWSLHHYVRYQLGWDSLGKLLSPLRCLPGVALVTALDLFRARLKGATDNQLIFLQK